MLDDLARLRMHVELHKTQRQAVGIGIIFAVFCHALLKQLGRSGQEREAILEAGANVEESRIAISRGRRWRWTVRATRTSAGSSALSAPCACACTPTTASATAGTARQFPDAGKIGMSIGSFRSGPI